MMRQLKAALDLGRVANLPTVWTNVLAAFALSSTVALPRWPTVIVVLGGTSLLYAGGCTLNDVCDAAFDRKHRPERAIPDGVLSRARVLALAIVELALGAGLVVAEAFRQGDAHLARWSAICVLGLVAAIVTYDLVHKRWGGAVWIMGLCRALLWLLPSSLPYQETTALVWVWAALLLLYIGGVTLTARGESLPSGKALSGAGAILLYLPLAGWVIGVVQLHAFRHVAGWLSIAFVIAFLAAVVHAMRLMKKDPPATIGPAVGWLLAAIPLIDALALSPLWPSAALALAMGLPLTRALQQHVAST